ncbi:MAG: transketolase [Acidimicrobiia bacterium]|nr:MAG: transketolase [Acidimicrobiia bacterium]
MGTDALEQRAVNVVRGLAMDAVQRAESGHPGTPMALAPLAHVLFTRVMEYDAGDGDWPDRDRFVLSAGHASMLLYSMLYLCGLGLELDDLREFRQWGSRTPGHPEKGHTDCVETTTGPLGQGLAHAVGMALAEQHLRHRFGAELTDHRVFVVCSDGDLMEGVSHEAASFAGHFRLGHLVAIYDDNRITIDGSTDLTCSDDVAGRFRAYGWHVVELGEVAEDLDALEAGLRAAVAVEDRPSLLVLRSHIGYPSPRYQDTPEAHGNPLGADEVARVKDILGLPREEFWVPGDVLAFYRDAGRRGAAARAAWEERRREYARAHRERFDEYEATVAGRGVAGWEHKLPRWEPGTAVATRVASADVLGAVFDVVPGLVGGGADLTANTGTLVAGERALTPGDAAGRVVHFGVREHAMAAIGNGMALSGLLPFVGTFFVFSDYMRPAVRLAAMMRAKTAFVWSHDSVGLGEDGPTHQPVEHLASLRAMPGFRCIRCADANEVAAAWRVHLDGDGPTGIVLTRQKVPVLEGTAERAPAGVPRGAYVLVDEAAETPELVLIGTGSEVAVCVGAREVLAADGLAVRVVSMPSWELFEAQDDAYRRTVLPAGVPTLAVEAAASLGWSRWADEVVAIDRFGESAPGDVALARLGFTPEHVAERARALLGRR